MVNELVDRINDKHKSNIIHNFCGDHPSANSGEDDDFLCLQPPAVGKKSGNPSDPWH